jgi:DNA-binding response OmpR family regulator
MSRPPGRVGSSTPAASRSAWRDSRRLVREFLEADRWLVTKARNGRKGLEHVADARPELIILDLMMPEVDGFRFAEELGRNEAWQTILVLVVTAKDLSDRERRLLYRYAFRVLEKGGTFRRELQDLIHFGVAAHARRRTAAAAGGVAPAPIAHPENADEELDVHAQDPAGRR